MPCDTCMKGGPKSGLMAPRALVDEARMRAAVEGAQTQVHEGTTVAEVEGNLMRIFSAPIGGGGEHHP